PCLSLLGSAEEIVDPAPIAQITPSWPQGKLAEFDSGAHELLMERPALRDAAYRATLDFLTSA
ncbi:MAG: alpha/beta hydrolase, partial [Mangrovicoccus sp.]|nr:alpha/beta hydrolase [Mangrovicoccus sp.]